MKIIFALKDVSCHFSSKFICQKIQNLNSLKSVYYNHFFNSFVIESDNKEEAVSFFKNNKINYTENYHQKSSILEHLTLLALLIISIITNKPYIADCSFLLILINGLLNIKLLNDELVLSFILLLTSLSNIPYITFMIVFTYYLHKYLKNKFISKMITNKIKAYNLTYDYIFSAFMSIKEEFSFNKKYYFGLSVFVILLFIINNFLNLKYPAVLFVSTFLIILFKDIIINNSAVNKTNIIKTLYKNSIITNNYKNIESIYDCDTIIFEKEHIITNDSPEVKDVYISQQIKPSDFYQIAYMLVKKENKPISNSIKQYLKNISLNSLDSNDIKDLTKKRNDFYKNHQIIYYNRNNMNNIKNNLIKDLDTFLIQGKNPILFIENSEVIGIINIQYNINNGVSETIAALQKSGKKTILIDNNIPEILNYYKNLVNIDEYYPYKNINDKLNILNKINTNNTVYISKNPTNINNTQILFNQNLNLEQQENIVICHSSSIASLLNIIDIKTYTNIQTVKENKLNNILIALSSIFINPAITYILMSILSLVNLAKNKRA